MRGRSASAPPRRGIEDVDDRLTGLVLRPHVDVGVDIHGDLRAGKPRELLHDLGVHALESERRDIGVAKLVQRPVNEVEAATVAQPPAFENVGAEATHGNAEHDRVVLVLRHWAPRRRPRLAGRARAEPLIYAGFIPEQLEGLRGPQGTPGVDGPLGLPGQDSAPGATPDLLAYATKECVA